MFNIKNSNLKYDCYQVQKQLLEVFYKKAALKNFAISKGKHLCWSLFLITLQAWGLGLYQNRLQHRCFSVNTVLQEAPILKNICDQLLLQAQM